MAEIPVIDISDDRVADELLAAAVEHGFIFIKNNGATGIAEDDIRHMFDLSASFFASPLAVKESCSINSSQSGKNRGWLGSGAETLDPGKQKQGDHKEAFNFSPHPPYQPLPPSLPLNDLLSFQTQCHALCQRLLSLIARALALPATFFAPLHDLASRKSSSGSILRLLYYPATEDGPRTTQTPDNNNNSKEGHAVRAGAHSDYGSLTLLFQRHGQPGLEILSESGGWKGVPVDPLDDPTSPLPILVNIGDLLSYWTNGLLRSTVHRVVLPSPPSTPSPAPSPPSLAAAAAPPPSSPAAAAMTQARYSIAYFCHPLDDTRLDPVPSDAVRREAGGERARRELDKVRALSGVVIGGGGGGGAGTTMATTTGSKGPVLTAKQHLDARLGVTYGIM